ncbi:MAG: hypothetical protein NTW87_18255 [Planctomycetota bacterium]|nr:hypothetical protein [Planctomycetota bacterium]
MDGYVPYDDLANVFSSAGAAAGLEDLISALQAGGDHHGLFRALLLKKRHELGLPLLNPGDLTGCPEGVRKEYKAYVDSTCRDVGTRYLDAGDIAQAWRYLRSIGEPGPVRAALEKLETKSVPEEVLRIALEEGVHPRRGFQMALDSHGLGRAIQVFESGFSSAFADRQYAAALLVRTLYNDLVRAVCKAILLRFNQLPPELELVELVRSRPWLFEKDGIHADAHHIAAVARLGLIVEDTTDLIMVLSINEYGRMLSSVHQPSVRAPFEGGFADQAKYARALLGENVDEIVEHFRNKLSYYQSSSADTSPVELTMRLLRRAGRRDEALDLWQQYLGTQAPERPGAIIPSFYELCFEAKAYSRLADMARQQSDTTAWAAARIMESSAAPPVAPTPADAPADKKDPDDLS